MSRLSPAPARPSHRAALPLLALALAAGCAQSQQETSFSAGEVLTVRRSYSNAHLIAAGDDLILVDTGLEADAEAFDEGFRGLGVDPAEIDLLVLTHAHSDHAGAAGWFRERYQTPILVGGGDEEMLAAGRIDEVLCPTDATARRRLEQDQAETYQGFSADRLLPVGQTLDLTTLGFAQGELVSLPGHTEGSLVLVYGEFAFVGDLLRGSITGRAARDHFYMCDLEANHDDIRWLLERYPEVDTWFPGHFGPLTRAAVEALVAEDG